MNFLAALFLATPIFGLSLHAPMLAALAAPDIAATPNFAVTVLVADEAGASAGTSEDGADIEVAEAHAESAPPPASPSEDEYVEQTRRRNSIAEIHRPFGIATWSAMTVTLGLGFIQYYNKYGFFADQGSNPCVQGDAIFGQGQCTGTPWLHLTAASVTTALYATTFTLSLMMPDPDNLASGPGEFASTLRMHKLLRWVHFGGMIAQLVLGAVVANGRAFGLDRANDYGTLQALATVHMGLGLVTWGALTWAGALMTF